ncbi:hypothetical protein RI367_001069 [Sorochytrium milnesiophthora]
MPGKPKPPSSFNHRFAQVNGARIHFVDEGPQSAHTVVFLVHGFPDIWYTWRFIIPALTARGYRVIVPSTRGYALSDFPYAPMGDEEAVEAYSTKTVCTDLFELCCQFLDRKGRKIVWVGHDWGSNIVWRMQLHYPSVVDAVASLCVPYTPPHTQYLSTDAVVKQLPHFSYQLVFEQQPVESVYDKNVAQFLQVLYQPHTSPPRMDLVDIRKLTPQEAEQFAQSCLLSPEELAYYVEMFERTGFHGGLSYYRVRRLNHRDEMPFVDDKEVKVPALFITAGHDPTFPPGVGKHMSKFVPRLTRRHVEQASHWVQQEQPEQVAEHLLAWLGELSKLWGGLVFKEKAKL